MSHYNFTLSPAYAVRGSARVAVDVVTEQMPAWTLLSAVMLASMIGAFIWFG